MKKSIFLGLILITILLTFNGCGKGDMGPEGPVGPPGTNSNVIGTNSVTVSSWTASGADWTASLTASGITQDIVDYGSVQVFIKYGSEWWALPDINGVNSTLYGFSVGNVSLLNSNSNGSQAPYPGVQTFRIIIISSSIARSYPTMDWGNYKEIKKAFNLAD